MKNKTPVRDLNVDYQHADKYHFCEGCEAKSRVERDGKVIRYSCPARFNPYDKENCIKGILFEEFEARKTGRSYARPTQVVDDEPLKG